MNSTAMTIMNICGIFVLLAQSRAAIATNAIAMMTSPTYTSYPNMEYILPNMNILPIKRRANKGIDVMFAHSIARYVRSRNHAIRKP